MQRQYVAIDLHRWRSVIVREEEGGQELGVTHIDNSPLTGLNQSSQHRLVEQSVGARPRPRRVSSSGASCGVCC